MSRDWEAKQAELIDKVFILDEERKAKLLDLIEIKEETDDLKRNLEDLRTGNNQENKSANIKLSKAIEKEKMIQSTIKQLKSDLDAIIGQKEEISEDIKQKTVKLENISESYTKKITELSKITKTIKIKKAENSKLDKMNETLEKSIENLKNEISVLNKNKESLLKDMATLEKQVSDKYKAKEAELKELKQSLEEREGDVSRKESWISDYRDQLAFAKLELEKVHGKILKHIIIPDVI